MKDILIIAAGVMLAYIGIIALNVFVLVPFARWLAFLGAGA